MDPRTHGERAAALAAIAVAVALAAAACGSDVDTSAATGSGGGTSASSGDATAASTGTGTASSSTAASSSTGTMVCSRSDECPGTECATPTCTAGSCTTTAVVAGTALADQIPGDCQLAVCDGTGTTTNVPDDADLPDDDNPCTSDGCYEGTATHGPAPDGTQCGPGACCDGMGSCVGGCISDADCAIDSVCSQSFCGACGECNIVHDPAGTPAGQQVKGDCQAMVCDGMGGVVMVADPGDVPDDGDACTIDACVNGVPANTPLCPPPQTCNQGVCS
jgi:hypothetical protein